MNYFTLLFFIVYAKRMQTFNPQICIMLLVYISVIWNRPYHNPVIKSG
jgi:hypothetical protein